MISANERNYQTLLTDRNLLTVVRESRLYILPILPHPLPNVLVPGEHDLLKDLPFYEVAHVVDPKARQDRLDQREKKREDGMLRQVPCGNRPTTRSTVCPTTKKKKPTTQLTKQVSALPLASLLASAPSASSSMTITEQDSAADTPSMGMKLETEIEPMMPRIIYEVEKEEDMAANLSASFKERQHKRLSESIAVAPPSAKKSCTEVPRSEPILNIQQMLKP